MMIHLKRNWPAKLLSLLAAIVMWFFIMRDQNPVMEVTYTAVSYTHLNWGYFFSTISFISDLTVTATRRFIILIISFLFRLPSGAAYIVII